MGYSPRGHKELDMTEQLHTHTHTHTYILLARFQHLKFELVGFSDDLCRVD